MAFACKSDIPVKKEGLKEKSRDVTKKLKKGTQKVFPYKQMIFAHI